MRVCYFGTYDRDYSRNRIMREAMQSAGIEVIECHVPLWQNTEDKVASARDRSPVILLSRAIQSYLSLLRKYMTQRCSYDVMVLGYAGQMDVFPARLLTWCQRKILVLDVFMSLYLIASERELPRQRLLRKIEAMACRLPDGLIIDTEDYAAWFGTTYGIPRSRFGLVPTGADDRVFQPRPCKAPASDFQVLYHGSFIPNHSVETIIEAASILKSDPRIRFELIGKGPDVQKAQLLARHYGLLNVTFHDWMRREDLVLRLSEADLCLGAFGSTPQSLMTIQNKIYEALAMGKPVITGDSPAIRRVFVHAEHLYLVPRKQPQALAEGIATLKKDISLRAHLSREGYRLFKQRFGIEALGRQIRDCLERFVESPVRTGR